MPQHTNVETTCGQCANIGSFLTPCGSQRWNSDCQAGGKVFSLLSLLAILFLCFIETGWFMFQVVLLKICH